jgi:putative endonuclease
MRSDSSATQDALRKALGSDGEARAVMHLEKLGYQVRDRNVSMRGGELDVVAEKGELLVFVEVRMRSTAIFGDPSDTISFAKRRKVVRAAILYLQRHRLWGRREVRFDVITVVGRGQNASVEHLPGAFDAGA